MEIIFKMPRKLSSEEMEKFNLRLYKKQEGYKYTSSRHAYDKFAGINRSFTTTEYEPAKIRFVKVDISDENTDNAYTYKIVSEEGETEEIEKFLEENLSEYQEGDFCEKDLLKRVVGELECKDVVYKGYQLKDVSELVKSGKFRLTTDWVAKMDDINTNYISNAFFYADTVLPGMGLENYIFLKPGGKNLEIYFDKKTPIILDNYDNTYGRFATLEEALEIYALYWKLDKYILQNNPEFVTRFPKSLDVRVDSENILEDIVEKANNFDEIVESKAESIGESIEISSMAEMARFFDLKVDEFNFFGFDVDYSDFDKSCSAFKEYIKWRIINEPDYLSKVIDEIKKIENGENEKYIALLGIWEALKNKEYLEKLTTEEKEKIKSICTMKDEKFSDKIAQAMLGRKEFCNMLFDEEMDGKQIEDVIKNKNGEYMWGKIPDNCIAKLTDYAIEQEKTELLYFLIKIHNTGPQIPYNCITKLIDYAIEQEKTEFLISLTEKHISGKKEFDGEIKERVLKEILERQGVRAVKECFPPAMYSWEEKWLISVYGGELEKLANKANSLLLVPTEVEVPDGFIKCFEGLWGEEQGILNKKGLRLKDGKLHLDIPEQYMGSMIGTKGVNIKAVEEKIAELMGIDKVKIILHPKEGWKCITLSEIEELVEKRYKKKPDDKNEADDKEEK